MEEICDLIDQRMMDMERLSFQMPNREIISLKKNEKVRIIQETDSINTFFQFKKLTIQDLTKIQKKGSQIINTLVPDFKFTFQSLELPQNLKVIADLFKYLNCNSFSQNITFILDQYFKRTQRLLLTFIQSLQDITKIFFNSNIKKYEPKDQTRQRTKDHVFTLTDDSMIRKKDILIYKSGNMPQLQIIKNTETLKIGFPCRLSPVKAYLSTFDSQIKFEKPTSQSRIKTYSQSRKIKEINLSVGKIDEGIVINQGNQIPLLALKPRCLSLLSKKKKEKNHQKRLIRMYREAIDDLQYFEGYQMNPTISLKVSQSKNNYIQTSINDYLSTILDENKLKIIL